MKQNTKTMTKLMTLITLLFTSLVTFAQVTKDDLEREIKPLTERVRTLQSENSQIKFEIKTLDYNLSQATKSIDSLRNQTQINLNTISQMNQKLTTSETAANQKIAAVDESLSKNSLYGIIGVLSAILGSGIIYWLLSKRQQTDKTDIIDQLSKTKTSIEESLVKEFDKQTELMEAQLHLIEQQKVTTQITPNVEPDHSLALKLADEITLIERNISLMDSGTKGLKQLSRSVSKLKDNLAANGYEMPELLGKPLNRGMHSIPVSTIPDENLEPGVEMITKIIKPQVNYNDKMIQAAQIEVSVGY